MPGLKRAPRALGPVITVIAGLALGVVAFNLLGAAGDGGERAVETADDGPPAAVLAEPSEFARRTLPPRLLHLYRDAGERLGLDWSVIAAVDQIEGGGGPAEPGERATAIGYALDAYGAPEDYRLAAEAHGGSPGYARAVLRLADRYRDLGAAEMPRAEGPLALPAEGPVVATFGPRRGILHDGIDIDAPQGRPVRAAASGLVASASNHPIFGLQMCVAHRFAPPLNGERRLTTCYGNQSRFAAGVGDSVSRGEVIGYAGCTGACLRPGVHFQLRLGSGPSAPVTDPAPFLEAPVTAIGGRPLEEPGARTPP